MGFIPVVIGILLTVIAGGSSGCGKAPSNSGPTNANNTNTFTYAQASQFCNAVANWNPSAVNLSWPDTPNGSGVTYLFENTQLIETNAAQMVTVITTDSLVNTACTITIANGKVTNVQ